MNKQKILKAGEIAKQIRDWIRPQITKGAHLVEIAEKIESKIIELGGKVAFPTNLSIDEIAAHYTPSYNDDKIAAGLLKVDFGVHVDGWIADTAFSIDLEEDDENKQLIEASEAALDNAIKIIKKGTSLGMIGKTIQDTIESRGFSPIINLTGHEMKEYELHAGLTISNVDNKKTEKIEEGLYAIEPFATVGSGKVQDGKPSGIYILMNERNIRNSEARKILNFITEEYKTLPFCSRWIVKKFGVAALFALKRLEDNGNLHQYPQLIESSRNKVSQAEHTVLVNKEVIVTTR